MDEKGAIHLEEDSHVFRHSSELVKQKKGGYLRGRVNIPPDMGNGYIEISLAPGDSQIRINSKKLHVHPYVLLLAKKPTGTRKRRRKSSLPEHDENSGDENEDEEDDLVSSDDWRIKLEMRGGKVYHQGVEIKGAIGNDGSNGDSLVFGKEGVPLTIVVPLQKKRKKKVCIEDVLEKIFENSDYINQGSCSIEDLRNAFLKEKKKEQATLLNIVRLRVRFLDRTRKILKEDLSGPIKNRKHKATVDVEIDQAYGNRSYCYTGSETRLIVILKNPVDDINAHLYTMKGPLKFLKPNLLHGCVVEVKIPMLSSEEKYHTELNGHCLELILSRKTGEQSLPISISYHTHWNAGCSCSNPITDLMPSKMKSPYSDHTGSPDSAIGSELLSNDCMFPDAMSAILKPDSPFQSFGDETLSMENVQNSHCELSSENLTKTQGTISKSNREYQSGDDRREMNSLDLDLKSDLPDELYSFVEQYLSGDVLNELNNISSDQFAIDGIVQRRKDIVTRHQDQDLQKETKERSSSVSFAESDSQVEKETLCSFRSTVITLIVIFVGWLILQVFPVKEDPFANEE